MLYRCTSHTDKKEWPRLVIVKCTSSSGGELALLYQHTGPYRYELITASTELERELEEKLSTIVTGNSKTLASKVEKILNTRIIEKQLHNV